MSFEPGANVRPEPFVRATASTFYDWGWGIASWFVYAAFQALLRLAYPRGRLVECDVLFLTIVTNASLFHVLEEFGPLFEFLTCSVRGGGFYVEGDKSLPEAFE